MKIHRIPVHAVLLSVYPIIFLAGRNMLFIRFEESLRSMAISAGTALVLLAGFGIILKNWDKAGALSSLIMALFFSFGHLTNYLEGWAVKVDLSMNASQLAWAWLLVFLIFAFIIVISKFPDSFTPLLNALSALMIMFPLVTILSSVLPLIQNDQNGRQILAQMRDDGEAAKALPKQSREELPDIYYIIFDGYARADKLYEYYGYDNSHFIKSLEQRGFYVADGSRSNYLNTTYSLNTSLNMLYFHDFPKNIFVKTKYNLRTNHVNDYLREHGYQIVVFESGTGDSDFQLADVFVSPQSSQTVVQPAINSFEQLLLRTTMGILLLEGVSPDENPKGSPDALVSSVNRELTIRRDRISHALEHITDYAATDGKFFLFAHIYSPHIPFLYGAGGETLQYHGNLNLFWYEPHPEDYIEYYRYQIEYLNRAVLSTIDRILEGSEKPVVILLQSDHGDDKFLDWEAPTTKGVDVRSAILNAIYFSDGAYEALYPTLTPVNTFRMVFNHWFGTNYPLLPDKVFFHEHPTSTPHNAKPEFTDACIEFNICLPKVEDQL